MMYKRNFYCLIACFSFFFSLQAQGVVKGFELGEVINMGAAYTSIPSLSFDMEFTYTDSVRQDSIVEQIPASYKIQNGMYWSMIDSTEMVQGNNYNVTVFHYDSVISISNPQQYANLMRLPFLDSLFLSQNIDSINVTQVNDSTRSLKMYFKPASLYSSFIINYDQNSYMIHFITYYIKTPAYDDGSGSGVSMVNIAFSNYSYQVIDDSYFREDKFIYKHDGQFFAQPPYNNFQLMVNTSN